MATTVEIVLPIFALVLLGWLAARLRVVSQEGARGLTAFVFYVAIPVLLFRNLAQGEPVAAEDLAILAAYFIPGLALFAVGAVLLGPALGLAPAERIVLAMGSVFSNNVQLGIPVILAAYGERALVLLMLIVSLHSVVMVGLPTALMEVVRGKGERVGPVLRQTATALAGNPVIVGLVLGIAWGFTGWPLPGLLDSVTDLLGAAAVPCSLFAMGASLAGYRLAGALGHAGAMAAMKLLAHPVLAWLLASQVLGLPPLQVAVATTAAALPVGINVFIVAQTYDAYVARATSAILLSTAASIVTVGLLVGHFRATVAG